MFLLQDFVYNCEFLNHDLGKAKKAVVNLHIRLCQLACGGKQFKCFSSYFNRLDL